MSSKLAVRILHGDCLDVLRGLEPESVHAVVTDPPYHLTNVAYDFRKTGSGNARQPVQVRSAGFMNQTWDGGDIAFRPETWAEVYRVMLPGAHLVAFGGTRTYHRMACAIEDAGFEIRDQLAWVYGSGFPKSHDVSKAIDRAAGAEREVVGAHQYASRKPNGTWTGDVYGDEPSHAGGPQLTAPATEAARQWAGWGTALKPSWEPIVLARKPLSEGTVAAQVLATGTGALNIDASRVVTTAYELVEMSGRSGKSTKNNVWGEGIGGSRNGTWQPTPAGRWPANLAHDGSPEVLDAFARFGADKGQGFRDSSNDTGTAARFFAACPWSEDELRFHYAAKADSSERAGSRHPTVKPVALMEWLVRLITPPGGTVLDPFCGTGSTLVACDRLGFDAIGIERDPQYFRDAHEKLRRFRARRAIGAAPTVPVLPGQGSLFGEVA